VDDFLIEHTTLARTFHQAQYHPSSPVLQSDQKWETGAMPFSGGIWNDPRDGLSKIWYQGVRKKAIAYATSRDGLHWEKPDPGIEPGTNIVHRFDHDTATIWLDLEERDPQKRFKMTLTPYLRDVHRTISGMRLFFSPDGIHWSDSDAGVGWCLDRSTFFFNPFRKVWVYSIKWNLYGFDFEAVEESLPESSNTGTRLLANPGDSVCFDVVLHPYLSGTPKGVSVLSQVL